MLQSKENTSEELIAGFELSEGKIFTSLHRGNRFSVFMAWSKCYVGIFIRLGRSLLLLGVIANCGSVVLEGPGYNNSDQIAFCLVLCVAVCIQLIYSSKDLQGTVACMYRWDVRLRKV